MFNPDHSGEHDMSTGFRQEEFVEQYCQAFAHGSGKEIADYYHAPCLTVRGDGSLHVFTSNDEIKTFFDNVVNTYRGEGMTGFGCSSPSVTKQGADCVSFSCEWIMQRDDKSVIRRWNQTYTIRNVDGSWKIIVSIFHV